LGIKTRITSSADYDIKGDSSEKLVDLCKQSGASYYLTGVAAKNYLRENLFVEERIEVGWMDYEGYPEYLQLYPPFEHKVSIIDLLSNVGPASLKYMKCYQR
jgi:hypothetical protein